MSRQSVIGVRPDWLRACGALAALDDGELAMIAGLARIVEFAVGEAVFEQGAAADAFYVIVSGRAEVVRGGRVAAEVGPGEIFGEMSMFNGSERVATVRAAEATRLLAFGEDRLRTLLLRREPAAVKLVQQLGTLTQHRMQRAERELRARVEPADPALALVLDEFRALGRRLLAGWALAYHSIGRPGKLAVTPTKPSATAADLAVAYSPGVAEPCLAIAADPDAAYTYTGKGGLVGVITDGSAVLGLGAIGPLAAKPVMEGKAVLLKRFGGVDAFDIEVAGTDPDTLADPDTLVDTVERIAPTFGGILLEDIAAPACFEVERRCQARLDIPVLHDDQHGTAVTVAAALINALEATGRRIEDARILFAGAGAGGHATARYLVELGARPANLVMFDADGIVARGREMPGYLREFAVDGGPRTPEEAAAGADVFIGLSAGDVLTPAMLRSMAPDPVLLALANPVPEIAPRVARECRPDALVATGRSDHPDQVNNVLAFPYLFRGALDARAREITHGMKRAATLAIAGLARRPVTAEAGYDPSDLPFPPGRLVPMPFDRRLLPEVAGAVAEAAILDGAARVVLDLDAYRAELRTLAEHGFS